MIGRRSHDDAQSFDEAWNGAAPRDQHIADLVAFAEDLCAAAAIEPSARFRSDLRAQLMTEAATVLKPLPPADRRPAATPSSAGPRRPRRRLVGLTATLVTSAGAVGLVASSASALPGETLYPVKRTVESVELTTLHRDDASRGAFQLGQAKERLTEARSLSGKGASDKLIAETLDDFSSAASDGSSRLFTDYTDRGKKTSVRQVNDFAAAASKDLSQLSSDLPDGAGDSFVAATRAVRRLATQASSLCSSCGGADVDDLVSAVTGAARKNPAAPKAKAAKDTADPAPKPAATQRPAAAPDDTGTGTADSAPTPRPAASPTPPRPTRTPSLSDVTDPLLGGLLGDEEQEGLVPGLLNGLLGGGRGRE
ncbi:DUF5667 domain-containing protein [Aeromicrobium chenweiae]|uniref:Uncharacterized protein n=1 Tax=Aeromicrobium chenweiae TaxID=2079793 RepID=A0A2S0WQE4_9ACTN|nr:DUF5667 domain-containing protein [Aeromicrobium chenweiae]AWB93556.1 hypothetical protein C3E78_15800 [Aeromicrobium chenweiae]TGN33205.1 hypothetical protein E4L97_05815 [Aeromicrobium chenweiae]